MLKWVPTLTTAILAFIAVYSTNIQNFEKGHARTAIILTAIYAVIKGLLPSPIATSSS